MAKTSGARVTFFFSLPDPDASLYGEAALLRSVDPERLEKVISDRCQAVLGAAVALAKAEGVNCASVWSAASEPYEGIIEAAERSGCDLILMASHGYRGVKGLLLGSQTQKVLTHSKLPVLVLR